MFEKTKRRVVVTGLGVVCPLGAATEPSWSNLLAGKSGISRIADFDVSSLSAQIAGRVPDFDVSLYLPAKEIKKTDVFIHYGVAAANQAIEDAGIDKDDEKLLENTGVYIGSGIGGLAAIEKTHYSYLVEEKRKISPFFIPSVIINMVSGYVSIMHGFKGPTMAMVSACTTGTHNIGLAARMIQYGEAQAMVAGGAEMATTLLGVGGFSAARALSASHNDSPEEASRPWDADRDGFVLGDGAGVLFLEEYEHARRRGARVYCELIGFAMNSDAYHITQPSAGGKGAAQCMKKALNDAQVAGDQVDYINAHGTSTPSGDKAESDAIREVFGQSADSLLISSNKSMIGHLLGAAGGVEAAFSVLAMRHQAAPPTINLHNVDPECEGLDYVAHEARQKEIRTCLSNSFGFGGTNGTLVFRNL